MLLLAHGRRLGLARVDLRDLGLERLDVLRQLRLVRLGLPAPAASPRETSGKFSVNRPHMPLFSVNRPLCHYLVSDALI